MFSFFWSVEFVVDGLYLKVLGILFNLSFLIFVILNVKNGY